MKICFELAAKPWLLGLEMEEGELYAKVINFATKKGLAAANKILENKSYYHQWGGGWGASITARKVDEKESASIKRRSKGFCGYDWMIDNIISHGSCYDKKHE